MERPRLLPETDFAIIVNNLIESKQVGAIIEKFYPHVKHCMFWNCTHTITYTMEGSAQRVDCISIEKATKNGLTVYALEEFEKLITDSDKPLDSVINTYNLY